MTSSAPAVDLVLLWHMHQPDYRDAADGRFLLPWVYLHATKDYCDMVAHVERHPGVKVVFNFVPVLLEQIDDYVAQFESGNFTDELLRLLQVADLGAVSPAERELIVDSSFHHNHVTMLQPFPQYLRLHEIFKLVDEAGSQGYRYLSGDYLSDLLTWYHLSWIGETERRANPLFGRLMKKGEGFTHEDRRQLHAAIGEILRGLLGRYRALAAQGRIEISTTPLTHPIGPLLLDFESAREAMPGAPLPRSPGYPGGAERLRWQMRRAIDGHERRFGEKPAGLWPGEGAVSSAFVAEAGDAGFRWVATSEGVLANSLGERSHAPRTQWLHRPWRVDGAPQAVMLFRDERLSDAIGFEYAKWHGRDAAAHLVGEIEAIARAAAPGEVPVVLVALDGENAWEYYPYNGYYFFEELYSRLGTHPFIRTRTAAEVARESLATAAELPRLVAGSWVLGTMSTWIGEPSKNRAWDLLCEAKIACDAALASGAVAPARRADVERQLGVCEGSDWFWWLGPYNPAHAVRRFDQLYRHNLRRLYQMIGQPAPAALDEPLSAGGGDPEIGGAMRRASGS